MVNISLSTIPHTLSYVIYNLQDNSEKHILSLFPCTLDPFKLLHDKNTMEVDICFLHPFLKDVQINIY